MEASASAAPRLSPTTGNPMIIPIRCGALSATASPNRSPTTARPAANRPKASAPSPAMCLNRRYRTATSGGGSTTRTARLRSASHAQTQVSTEV